MSADFTGGRSADFTGGRSADFTVGRSPDFTGAEFSGRRSADFAGGRSADFTSSVDVLPLVRYALSCSLYASESDACVLVTLGRNGEVEAVSVELLKSDAVCDEFCSVVSGLSAFDSFATCSMSKIHKRRFL